MSFVVQVSDAESQAVDAVANLPAGNVESHPFVGLLLLIIIGCSIALWSRVFLRWSAGKNIGLPFEPRETARWGLIDFAVGYVLLYFIHALSANLWKIGVVSPSTAESPSEVPFESSAIFMTTYLAIIPLLVCFILFRCATNLKNVGFDLSHIAKDLRIGLVAFVMIYPATVLLFVLATLFFEVPYSHPLVESVSQKPELIIVAGWIAIVAAPLLEEFAFRVLLQGYLQSLSRGQVSIQLVFFGRRDRRDLPNSVVEPRDLTAAAEPATEGSSVAASLQTVLTESSDSQLPYEAPKPWHMTPATASREDSDFVNHSSDLPIWPMIVPGVLFGLAHLPYGVSALPLVVMGIGMGYLYRMTNRIWPSVFCHALFNSITIIALALQK